MGAMLVLALAALLTWRLSDGPVSIDILAPYVSDALNADDGSVSFEIDRGDLILVRSQELSGNQGDRGKGQLTRTATF